jgi:AAA domain
MTRRKLKRTLAPTWLITQTSQARPRASAAGMRLNEETENSVARMWKYIRDEAPEATEGYGGDATTHQVAKRLFDFGVTRETAWEGMLEWNEAKAYPCWRIDDLEAKLEGGLKYRQRPVGGDNPDPGTLFDGIDLGPGEEASIAKAPAEVQLRAGLPPKKGFLTFEESCEWALRGRDPLIDKVLYAGEISATYGDSGVRKSMMMMDIFFHIARGGSWHGHAVVERTAVFWVAAEGGLSAHLRNRALMKHYQPEGPVPFGILEQPINLLRNAKDTVFLIDEIKRARDHFKQEIGILEIDTYNAVTSGSDEGVADTGVMLEQLRLIREKIGRHLHINVTHHTGKDASRGMRGSSSLRAAVECTIEVRKDGRTAGTAWLKKQRDGESDVELLRFEGRTIDIGPDEKGRPLGSQVIVPRVQTGAEEIERNLEHGQPWVAMGIDRSTFYRRRKRATGATRATP